MTKRQIVPVKQPEQPREEFDTREASMQVIQNLVNALVIHIKIYHPDEASRLSAIDFATTILKQRVLNRKL